MNILLEAVASDLNTEASLCSKWSESRHTALQDNDIKEQLRGLSINKASTSHPQDSGSIAEEGVGRMQQPEDGRAVVKCHLLSMTQSWQPQSYSICVNCAWSTKGKPF